MSDFIAIVNIGVKVLHIVEWDKPVWFLADNPNGSRIIPRPHKLLKDALVSLQMKNLESVIIS